MTRQCPICGGPVPDRTGKRGGAARYCGTGCRRARKYALRRCQTELTRIEQVRTTIRVNAFGDDDLYLARLAKRESELQARLCELLADDDATEAPAPAAGAL